MEHPMKPVEEMTPSEWLATLRKKYDLPTNFDFPDSWMEDLLSKIPVSDREAARKIWVERRKKTLSQVHDELMEEYLQQVLPVLYPDEKKIAETIFFGILPTYQFNAYIGFTPRGDRIAIFHQALGYTLAYWSHWYLRLKECGVDNIFEKSEQTLAYFINIWLGNKPKGKLPDIYPETEDSWKFDECLALSAISFVIGHELGHVLSGHTQYSSNRDLNHEMEFEADRIGLSIVIRHSLVKTVAIDGDTYHTKFMLFGPLFTLAVLSLFGNGSSDTHPSPSIRRIKLLAAYRQELQAIFGDRLDNFLDEIDHDVFNIFETNSRKLFEIFSIYRDIINEMKSDIQKKDTSWLKNELANFWL
jgi:hypothetical protein